MDFLFPHLENVREIGEALTGKPFANIWMIAERVWSARKGKGTDRVDENKPVRELFAMGFSAREVRYWLLSTHYRKPIQATSDNISNTVRGLRRIDEFTIKVRASEDSIGENAQLSEMICILDQEFLDSLADDLNLPHALAAIFRFIRQANPIIDGTGVCSSQKLQILDIFRLADSILGFFDLSSRLLSPTEEKLIRDREVARKEKNWADSDRIRNELLKCGIRVVDTPAGSRWEYCRREDQPPPATDTSKNFSLTEVS
jgi:cysteinyl-tRNA synthetase